MGETLAQQAAASRRVGQPGARLGAVAGGRAPGAGRARGVPGRGPARRPTCARRCPRSAITRPARRPCEAVRAFRADWAEIFVEQIGREEDARILTTLFSALGDRSADVSRKILRSPRSAPRAFVWLLRSDARRGQGRVDRALRRHDGRPADGRVLGAALAAEGVLRAGRPRRGARAPGGLRGGGAGAAPRPRPRRGPRGAPSRHRARGAPDEVPGAARAGARVPLRDGGVDRGAAPGAAAPEAGRASGQRAGHEDRQGARRPARELRVPRRPAEARVPLGADRDASPTSCRARGRSIPTRDRRVGGPRRDARPAAGATAAPSARS